MIAFERGFVFFGEGGVVGLFEAWTGQWRKIGQSRKIELCEIGCVDLDVDILLLGR